MTIKRQYSLPNCTLVLEGLSNEINPTGQFNSRPLISIATNAECRFSHSPYTLTGGRDFLENLVKSVSAYAQELLSGIRHPQTPDTSQDSVHLEKAQDSTLHRLTWQEHPEAQPIQIDLNNVQFFDLVEAVDQFLNDSSTLPDLSLQLQPISRRYRKADEPLTQRTAPLAVGVGSFALAAAALFFTPIPKVTEPEPVKQSQTEEETAETTETAEVATEESPPETKSSEELDSEEIEALLSEAKPITDATEIGYIQDKLYKDIYEDWEDRDEVDRNLEYRVSATQDGSIVAFEPVEGTSKQAAKQTPLPDLIYTPTSDTIANKEEIAEFRVVFTDNGILQISSWDGVEEELSFGPEITDKDTLRSLVPEVKETITDAWSEAEPSFSRDLVYRVGVTEDGVIAQYEAENQSAWDFADETPLPKL
ncbi:MAG: DUF4335 domain-containing protein, partial [Spirulinaceae cyanobacterium]